MVKILTFGEIIWDIYGSDEVLGGAGLNFAAHAGKCGAEQSISHRLAGRFVRPAAALCPLRYADQQSALHLPYGNG